MAEISYRKSWNFQNPNLTTTQPKPNLNLVGFDMIITLHHPPISISTTRNGPRGLKFVMQHHPSILTTTQHNLTLLLSGGGPPTRVNPTNIFFSLQKIFLDNYERPNKILTLLFSWGGGHQPLPPTRVNLTNIFLFTKIFLDN